MRKRYLDFLVWLAAKLNSWANKIFHHALNVTLDDQEESQSEANPPPTPPPEEPVEEEKTNPRATLLLAPVPVPTTPEQLPAMPIFTGTDGKPIPPSFDELPSKEIFQAMFERKYGKWGQCPMSLGGQMRLFDCDTLYALLQEIRAHNDVSPMHVSVYGTVMAVIMHAYGEPVDSKALN
jgi:hypothetical protein